MSTKAGAERLQVKFSFETDLKNIDIYGITVQLKTGEKVSLKGDYSKILPGPNGSYSITLEDVKLIGTFNKLPELTPDTFEAAKVTDVSFTGRKRATFIIKTMEFTVFFENDQRRVVTLNIPIFSAKAFEFTEDDITAPMEDIKVGDDGKTITAKLDTMFDAFNKFGIPQYIGYDSITTTATYNVEANTATVSCTAHAKVGRDYKFNYTPTETEVNAILEAITYTVDDETGLTLAQLCEKHKKPISAPKPVTPPAKPAPQISQKRSKKKNVGPGSLDNPLKLSNVQMCMDDVEPVAEPVAEAVIPEEPVVRNEQGSGTGMESPFEYMRELCYELYKIHWMQGVTISRRMFAWKQYFKDYDASYRAATPFQVHIEKAGYDGKMYVSYDEFLETEYRSTDYMKKLLEDNDLYNRYLNDLEILKIVVVPQELIDVCVATGWSAAVDDEFTTISIAGDLAQKGHESVMDYKFVVMNKGFVDNVVTAAGSFDPESYAVDKLGEFPKLGIRKLLAEADGLNNALCMLADELEKKAAKAA